MNLVKTCPTKPVNCCSTMPGGGGRRPAIGLHISKPSPVGTQSLLPSTGMVVTPLLKRLGPLGLPPSPQLDLLSVLFALSMAIGAILSLAIISIPTVNAFTKMVVSLRKLANVVSEEVPGTLFSLKLSALEIDELAQQLSNLRPKDFFFDSLWKQNQNQKQFFFFFRSQQQPSLYRLTIISIRFFIFIALPYVSPASCFHIY